MGCQTCPPETGWKPGHPFFQRGGWEPVDRLMRPWKPASDHRHLILHLLEAAKVKKGSPESNRDKVASVSWQQVKVIAQDKMPDLNAFTVESAMKMVAGTARSMGITVQGEFPSNL